MDGPSYIIGFFRSGFPDQFIVNGLLTVFLLCESLQWRDQRKDDQDCGDVANSVLGLSAAISRGQRMEFGFSEFTPHAWPLPVIRRSDFPRTGCFLKSKGRHLPDSNQADAPSGDPIAFFTALQIISREKGFSRKSNIRSFSALNATELGS